MKIYLVMGCTEESSWVQSGYFNENEALKECNRLQEAEDEDSAYIYYLAKLDVKE